MSKYKYLVLLLTLITGLAFSANNAHAVPPAVKAKSEFLLADKLFNKQDYKGAIEHAEKAKSILGKSNSRIEYMLTKAYFKSGDFDKAMKAVNVFFEMTPESESASESYNEMVAMYSEIELAKKKKDAEPTWEESVNLFNSIATKLAVESFGEHGNVKDKQTINEILEHFKEYHSSGFDKIEEKLRNLPAGIWIIGKDIMVWEVEHSYFKHDKKVSIKTSRIPIKHIASIAGSSGFSPPFLSFRIDDDGYAYATSDHWEYNSRLTDKQNFKSKEPTLSRGKIRFKHTLLENDLIEDKLRKNLLHLIQLAKEAS